MLISVLSMILSFSNIKISFTIEKSHSIILAACSTLVSQLWHHLINYCVPEFSNTGETEKSRGFAQPFEFEGSEGREGQ